MIVDTHVHVVNPQRFPIPAGPGYKPTAMDVGTADELGRVFERHNVYNAVIVQLSGYGTDNTCILDAVARSDGAWRAIVSLKPDVDDRELDQLQRAGVVGVRFNVKNLGTNALTGQSRLLAAMQERNGSPKFRLRQRICRSFPNGSRTFACPLCSIILAFRMSRPAPPLGDFSSCWPSAVRGPLSSFPVVFVSLVSRSPTPISIRILISSAMLFLLTTAFGDRIGRLPGL